MKYRCTSVVVFMLMLGCGFASGQETAVRNTNYIANRQPLVQTRYVPLPLGSIRPSGWLLRQLRYSADGMTGHLDEIWKDVGPDNGWLGGNGETWERGPYWLDGLTPLAYTLNDKALIAKVQRWVEWMIAHQRADGYFGPVTDSSKTFGPGQEDLAEQERLKEDWWPHMVMLKVLQQYHDATGDQRVLDLMTRYFRFENAMLPSRPLEYWTDVAQFRGGENLSSIYWLYNRTGERFLLELADLVFRQTSNWTAMFESGAPRYWHGVHTAMGIKQPALYFQQTGDPRYLKAVQKGIDDLMKYHGQIEGVFSGDEWLHGTDPTQGTELCTVVEFMYSLETLVGITGEPRYADQLERVAFNALPTQLSPDHTGRQYYQLPNQIVCDSAHKNFNTQHVTALLYGLENGYGCCTANYHQGWPKFTAHLWMATQTNGLAAMVYAPCEVTARVAGGIPVTIREETGYPFEETITMTVSPEREVEFPLSLRIPGWCASAVVQVNGVEYATPAAGSVLTLQRRWGRHDTVRMVLPMVARTSRWHEESLGIERGPLVYALRIREEWRKVEERGRFSMYAVYPRDPWNYALVLKNREHPGAELTVEQKPLTDSPWTVERAPILLHARAVRLPHWRQYNGAAGPLPWSPVRIKADAEDVVLIPYGCSRLRISEFPFIR